jgi:hypothetical protein
MSMVKLLVVGVVIIAVVVVGAIAQGARSRRRAMATPGWPETSG